MASIVSGPVGDTSWSVYAGDSNRETFEFLAGDSPWNITGALISAQVRERRSDPGVALLTATVTLVDPVNGLATVEWDGDEVRAMMGTAETWTGVWDLQIVEPGETLPRTLMTGKFTARWDVTRP